jgi:FdhD protein
VSPLWNAPTVNDALRPSITRVPVVRVEGTTAAHAIDTLAVEEPLEIRLAWTSGDSHHDEPVSITMRTPGHDVELAIGFLVGEGIVKQSSDVVGAAHVGPGARPDGTSNAVRVELVRDATYDLGRLARHFYATSSCGVCGKASIDALRIQAPALAESALAVWTPDVLHALPATLRARQAAFEETGGLHAAALFDAKGNLSIVREDVGRHNALDKVVGALAMQNALPASESLLLVSGRASFELVQKALMAGVPGLAAVGAPSSLAVELAREAGMTLVGFLRNGRFNVYAGRGRLGETEICS